VEVAALLHGGLHRRRFIYLILMQFIVDKASIHFFCQTKTTWYENLNT
jgi:hypothetical protein